MAISVIEKIEIETDPAQVATVMFDPNNTIRWVSGIKEVRDIQNLPLQVGTTQHRIADFVGKEVDFTLEVREYIPDQLLVMTTKSGPFPMQVTYQIYSLSEGRCTAEVRLEGSSKGFLMFLDRLSTIMVSEQLKGDLQTLKDMAEGVSWLDK